MVLEGMLRGKGETALANRVLAVIEQRRQARGQDQIPVIYRAS